MAYEDFIKTPRLYVDSQLADDGQVILDKAQSHYLTNVMRRKQGDRLRLFNGRNGEWGADINSLSKKEVVLSLIEELRPQPDAAAPLHLAFAPVKKQRTDFMIEKAVELGVTHLHPVITHHTEVRKLNTERIEAQIVEAAEQCERLDMPDMSALVTLSSFLERWGEQIPIAACIERGDYPFLGQVAHDLRAFFVGPEGGFSMEEVDMIKSYDFIIPVSLGENIMRAETAALFALSICKNNFDK